MPKAHNRLRQTHDLWHEMQAAYSDADVFVARLNAYLTAARSVTFVVQKELSKQAWFESWYAPWQERMRADERMRWLVDARNRVEKQGDLDTASIALASLILTDGDYPLKRLEVSPLAGPAEIAAALRLEGLEDRIREQAVLEVERRWTLPELDDGELLDVLAYCFGVLAELIVDAHAQFGVVMHTFGGEEHGDRHARRPHPSGCLPCMVATAEKRTAYWHLGEETLIEYARESMRSPNPRPGRSEDRYGFLDGNHGLMPGMPIERRGAVWHELGKRMLEVDKTHCTFAWLLKDESQVVTYPLDFVDQQDKIVKLRRLAADVERTGAGTLMFSGESWFALEVDEGDPRHRLRAGQRADRREALVTYVLTSDGFARSWITTFSKNEAGEIVLGETTENPEFTGRPFFSAVLRVWEGWNKPRDRSSTE